MSYWCDKCDNLCDKMLEPPSEFPEGSSRLICPDCMCDIEDENEALIAEEKANE